MSGRAEKETANDTPGGHIVYDKKKTRKISEGKTRWETENLGKTLKRSPERLSRFSTVSDEEIAALYTPDRMEEFD